MQRKRKRKNLPLPKVTRLLKRKQMKKLKPSQQTPQQQTHLLKKLM
jgi:hypothetical protein